MEISKRGLDVIKYFEGLRLEAYQCSADVWTVGYGHTDDVKPGDKISEKQADELLLKDIKWAEDTVNNNIRVPITQGIFDSLVSFTFNVGVTAFANSTLKNLLNKGFYASAGDQILRWDKVRGQAIPGLTARRQVERKLFYSQAFPKL